MNRLWRDFALYNGIKDLASVCEGVNYLDVCRRAARGGDTLAEKALRVLEGVLGYQTEQIELEYPCHSPTVKRWFLLKANSFGNGLVMLHVDITKRILAEEALAAEERKFRLIAENSEDVFWISSPGAEKIIYVSPAYRQIWGRDQEELYRDPALFLNAVHPQDRDSIRVALTQRAGVPWSGQFRILRPDGAVRWIHYSRFPVGNSDGQPVFMAGIASDITERKQSEDKIINSRDELERRVKERTKALDQTDGALQFLLGQREQDRKKLQEMVLANVRHSIRPYLDLLGRCSLTTEATDYLKIVTAKIEEITSSFVKNLSDRYLDLTPMEIRVAELIKDGHATKDIGTLLHLSAGTIRYHRENLRCKLGIKNKHYNLVTFLKNME
ncbi:MAG: PAS domain-containing protein [Syntrophobacteraceae bacterium]|nr:PAS domain-containing protein [Syntrophobacteraceae bacterium]